MTTPTTTPVSGEALTDDVMKAAQAAQDAAMARCKEAKFAVYEYPFNTGRAKDVLDEEIAKAIWAERERAAKLAAEFVHNRLYKPRFPACSYHSSEIADAIRAPSPTLTTEPDHGR